MGLLGREVILGTARRRELVVVPEFGGRVGLQAIGYAERLEFDAWVRAQAEDSQDTVLGLLIFSMVDEEGKRVLSLDDLPELRQADAVAIRRLTRVALRLNSMDAEVDAAKGES